MSAPLLAAAGLRKSYRRGSEVVHALDDVDFSLMDGELVALVGRSGSGKSTLLNVLAGWERPDEGRLSWSGEELREPRRLPWDEVSAVPQSLGLIEELNVRANIELPTRLNGSLDDNRERVDRLIEHFGLRDLQERMPDQTSLGEQQRTALARALVLRPRLLLADEPTGHQDATWAMRVIATLTIAAGEGSCCLVATHSDKVADYAGTVLHMKDGRIES